MERSDYYFRHIIFQKVRVGTRVPLINRDPHNLPIKHKGNEDNVKRGHSLIQGVNYHELKERNFNHNEQIKLMLRSLRGFQRTINTTFAVSNSVNNNVSPHKLLTPITSRKNKIIIDQQQQQQPLGLVNNLRKVASSSQIPLPLNDNNGNNSQVSKSLHLTPIKRLQRNQSQSQSLQISKSESKRKLKLLSGVRIKNVFSRTRTGETAETIKNMLLAASQAKKNQNQKTKKTKNETPTPPQPQPLLTPTLPVPKPKRNEDAVITKWDFISKTFGKISLFGVLNGIGVNGYYISRLLRNYFIDYFEKQSIETSMNKDNFYTILSQAFINANTYLKNCKYDCDFSGATGLLLFFPEGHDDIIYCANAGHSKAVAYSHTQSYPLSYEHYPSLISEKERIQQKGGNVNGELITMSSNTLNKIYQQLNARNIDITKYRDEFTNGFRIARTMGCFYWEDAGVIAEPQVVECNLKREDTKAIVIGTDGLWKYLQIDQVGEIVMRYYEENNIFGACKELEETARLKWRKYSKEVDDISVIVLFLQWEKVKV